MSTFNSVITAVRDTISGGKLKPAKILPAALLLCTSMRRPGMSALDITSDFIAFMDENNIPTGRNTDGSSNLLITFAHGIIKSIVKSIKMNSVVTVAGAPGTITFTGVGSNGGGTMVVKGTNDAPFEIQGNVT